MKEAVLKLLITDQGKCLSGEELSKKLAVSRTAIWKHINSLKAEGYQIVSYAGKGYCLVERPDILTLTEIKTGLPTAVLGHRLLCFAAVDSTNEVAKREAINGAPEGTVIIAEEQERGKGRMERQWVSPPGVGLWFSLVLRPKLQPAQAAQMTFVSAVAVCGALRKVTGLPFCIKWPNDILIENKKVCGILTELSAEIEQVNFIVVGIGLNVNQQREAFPSEIRSTATSLFLAAGRTFNRAELFREILLEYECQYQKYLQQGFKTILAAWRTLNGTLGQSVLVSTREGSFSGVAEDITEHGCLIVKKETGDKEILIAGDVSLRGDVHP